MKKIAFGAVGRHRDNAAVARSIPFFIEAEDPWICKLQNDKTRYIGLLRKEYENHLAVIDIDSNIGVRLGILRNALDKCWPEHSPKAPTCSQIRKQIFSGESHLDNTNIETTTEHLYGDVKVFRRISAAPRDLDSVKIRYHANDILLRKIISNASWLELEIFENSRRIIRQIQWSGLLWSEIQQELDSKSMKIHISGPLSLFGSTRIYTSALYRLLPVLAWQNRFVLDIFSHWSGQLSKFKFTHDDAQRFGKQPECFDSKLESSFFSDFVQNSKCWEIVREPEGIRMKSGLFFPDFKIFHKFNGDSCFLEIVGFWRPEYLKQKAQKIMQFIAENPNEKIIVCMDKKFQNFEFLDSSLCILLKYTKSVCVADVLNALGAWER